ncbi:MAG: hypothetical protein ABSD75_11610 [Terriglobales bacterium]
MTATKRASKKNGKKKPTAKKKDGTRFSKATGSAGPLRRRKTRANDTRRNAAFQGASGRSRSGLQSGDLQGLRDIESADSESVSELLEEGNAFEADVIAGVENVEDGEEQEVHTHEVPEDDVPEEYLDKD